MKAIEQHFHVVLFIMLHKVVLTFKSVYETLVCDHYYIMLYKVALTFEGISETPSAYDPSNESC